MKALTEVLTEAEEKTKQSAFSSAFLVLWLIVDCRRMCYDETLKKGNGRAGR